MPRRVAKPKVLPKPLSLELAQEGWDITLEDGEEWLRVKPRPRGGRHHFYMPDAYREWRDGLASEVEALMGGLLALPIYPAGEPLEVELLAGGKRGDVDNLAGGILDALNGVLWADDKQIRRLTVDRVGLPPGVKWRLRVRLDAREP